MGAWPPPGVITPSATRWTIARGTCSSRADDGRSLAASLVALESVAGVTFDVARGGLVVQTGQARELATALPGLARDSSIRLLEVRALDDSLESLFRELVR